MKFSIYNFEKLDATSLEITAEHCQKALEAVTVTSLYGINLHPPGTKDLSDIGGLTEVKEIVMETMLWPSKVNKALFDISYESPIRKCISVP